MEFKTRQKFLRLILKLGRVWWSRRLGILYHFQLPVVYTACAAKYISCIKLSHKNHLALIGTHYIIGWYEA